MTQFASVTVALLVPFMLWTTTASAMGRKAPPPAPSPPAHEARPPASGPSPAPTPAGDQPRIVFEEKVFDFGELIGAEKVEHVYKFRNQGTAELKIDKVSTTCGCTAALLSSKVIPPGGSGEVNTTFTVSGRKGKQRKSIFVASNDPVEPRAELILTGVITPPVYVDPENVILRDTGAPPSRTVKISQSLPQELTIESVAAKLNLVDTKLTEDPPEGGKKHYSLDIALKPDIPVGQHFETVTIVTNCAAKPRIDLPVRISILGDIQATPSRIYLGSLAPGQEINRQFTLTSSRGQPFAIEAIEVDNKDFTVQPQAPLKPAISYSFTLSGKPTMASGGVRGKVVFRTDNPKQKTVELTVYGYARRDRPAPGAPRQTVTTDVGMSPAPGVTP